MYLSVLSDKHIDDIYAVFINAETAIRQCKEWEKWYLNKHGYKFDVEEVPGWNYYSTAGDDLPNLHVEKIEYNVYITYEEMLEKEE